MKEINMTEFRSLQMMIRKSKRDGASTRHLRRIGIEDLKKGSKEAGGIGILVPGHHLKIDIGVIVALIIITDHQKDELQQN